ncbi:VOC family protein [Cupriavidus basilensis]|uniref:VOC family protein n=1 Tax=Cupriavidus TaxID=106589 RepID=UPI0004520055|nr:MULTISPECIES: VOC family protein [Cupriavidus]KDP88205.1 lactoylglutathione lyase [Cupriavidus sp. SK-3]MDF3880937.1 VOC family protein [Cupriavidus basilensis]
MFHILGIDHLVLRTGNVTALMRFYVDVLGCSLERVQPDFGLIQLRAGGGLIDLVALDGPLGRVGGAGPGKEGRNLDHFCLRLAPFDADALGAHLRAHGVEPGPVEMRFGAEGKGPSIYVQDPDGNVVELKGPPANM